jgi:hypothetical protein
LAPHGPSPPGDVNTLPGTWRAALATRAATYARIAGRVRPNDVPMLSDKTWLARRAVSDQGCQFPLRMTDGAIKYLWRNGHESRDGDGRPE